LETVLNSFTTTMNTILLLLSLLLLIERGIVIIAYSKYYFLATISTCLIAKRQSHRNFRDIVELYFNALSRRNRTRI